MVESAVQSVIGLRRVLNCALEANIRQATQPNTPVMTFMVKTRQPSSTDSLWIRRRHAGNREMAKFGENTVPACDEVQ